MLYVGCALGIMNQTGYVGTRMLLVAVVLAEEVARSQGLVAVCETLAAMMRPAYEGIYNATLDWHPGMVYCLASVLNVAVVAIFLAIYVLRRVQSNRQKKDEERIAYVE